MVKIKKVHPAINQLISTEKTYMSCVTISQFCVDTVNILHNILFNNFFKSLKILKCIVQARTIWSIIIHILKYLRSMTLGCIAIGIRNSEFVAKTRFSLIITITLFTFKYLKTNTYIYCKSYCTFR